MRILLRRLLRYPIAPGVFIFLLGFWQASRAVLLWIYGAWNLYDFIVLHFGPIPGLGWALNLSGRPWFGVAALIVGLVWMVVGLQADAVFLRAQRIAPTLRHFIGLSNRIQREMINERNKRGTVDDYATRIDREWRAALGTFLNAEIPAATQIVLEKLGPAGADPFTWECSRLQRCTQKLESVLASLDYWIRVSDGIRRLDADTNTPRP